MKYAPLAVLFALAFAFMSIRPAFLPKAEKQAVPAIETTIGCAPPETYPVADYDGKFITALPGLGKHAYAISTHHDSTQFYFNQGINFYYSYNLRESLVFFKEAARFDSSAAMIYWGQALSMGLYFNVYTYKIKKAVPAALAAMNRYKDNANPKEKELIDAMQKRYSNDTTN